MSTAFSLSGFGSLSMIWSSFLSWVSKTWDQRGVIITITAKKKNVTPQERPPSLHAPSWPWKGLLKYQLKHCPSSDISALVLVGSPGRQTYSYLVWHPESVSGVPVLRTCRKALLTSGWKTIVKLLTLVYKWDCYNLTSESLLWFIRHSVNKEK